MNMERSAHDAIDAVHETAKHVHCNGRSMQRGCLAGCDAEYVANVRPWCRLAEHVADTEKCLDAGRGTACAFVRCLKTDFEACDTERIEDDFGEKRSGECDAKAVAKAGEVLAFRTMVELLLRSWKVTRRRRNARTQQ